MSDERQELDDELLSAYLDGELSQPQADELTSRVAREPELAERLEAMRSVDKAAVAAFRAVDERQIPERILDLMGEDEEARRSDAGEASNVVQIRRPAINRFIQPPVAIAASVALVVGFYLRALLGDGGAPDREVVAVYASRIPAGSDLRVVFERNLSGESINLSDRRVAEPVLTFRGVDGNYCRQVRITGAAKSADALACRRDGNWEVEVVSFDAAASAAPESPYGQASSGGAAAMRGTIERLIGQEPPLDRTEEAEIMGKGWQGGGSDGDGTE
ncbi:MAG: hypothetical protein ACREQ8_06155 [Woeseiaceae bacterium]